MRTKNLHGTWGLLDDKYDGSKENPYRYKSRSFYGDKWSALLAEAETWALAEVDKLVVALNVRKQALLDAEID